MTYLYTHTALCVLFDLLLETFKIKLYMPIPPHFVLTELSQFKTVLLGSRVQIKSILFTTHFVSRESSRDLFNNIVGSKQQFIASTKTRSCRLLFGRLVVTNTNKTGIPTPL